MKQLPSPNFDSRDGHAIDMLVLHYTGMQTAQAALDRLCDPIAKVSAHYVVDEDGSVYQLVAEEQRAWHAGVSAWRGHSNINQRSIGIEIVNPGHEFGYRPFTEAQTNAVAKLCMGIVSRHSIPARNVVGHSDVAPSRKEDPGELFDWKWLAEHGVGLWPDPDATAYQATSSWWEFLVFIITLPLQFHYIFLAFWPSRLNKKERKVHGIVHQPINPAHIQAQLRTFGYACPQTSRFDAETTKVILAFQRHYRPQFVTGKWDRTCSLLLHSLLTDCGEMLDSTA